MILLRFFDVNRIVPKDLNLILLVVAIIKAVTLLHLFPLSLYCPIPTKTRGKHCEFSPFWKFELLGLFSHWVQDLEKPKGLSFKLLITLGLDIFALQQNFVAKGIAFWFCSLIMISFLDFLGMLETFSTHYHEISQFDN